MWTKKDWEIYQKELKESLEREREIYTDETWTKVNRLVSGFTYTSRIFHNNLPKPTLVISQ